MTAIASLLALVALAIGGLVIAGSLIEVLRRPMDAEARKAAPGEFATLGNGVTYYEWHGPSRGPVVVLVHGLTAPSYVWAGLIQGLTMIGYRVLCYDLYGRGFSDRPDITNDRELFVNQLEELLVDQGATENLSLIGYSMGGAIVTAYAVDHPERVDRIVLLAPTGLGQDLGWFARIATKVPGIGDALARVFGGILHRRGIDRELPISSAMPGFNDRYAAESGYRGFLPSVLSSMRHFLNVDQSADHAKLGKTGLPVLAIWGEIDKTIPLRSLSRLTEANRNTRQISLPGTGHELVYTHPREVLAAMEEFLREG